MKNKSFTLQVCARTPKLGENFQFFDAQKACAHEENYEKENEGCLQMEMR